MIFFILCIVWSFSFTRGKQSHAENTHKHTHTYTNTAHTEAHCIKYHTDDVSTVQARPLCLSVSGFCRSFIEMWFICCFFIYYSVFFSLRALCASLTLGPTDRSCTHTHTRHTHSYLIHNNNNNKNTYMHNAQRSRRCHTHTKIYV